MQKEITYKQLNEIIRAVNSIPSLDEEKKQFKDLLAKMVLRFSKKLAHHIEDYNELVEDADIKNCLKNDKGAIIYDAEGRYQRTEAHLKERRKELKEIGYKQIFIEPCICGDTTRVESLPLWVLEKLDGILFNAPKDLDMEEIPQNGQEEIKN